MKQLNVSALNAKDTKDRLALDPRQEAVALSDYAAAGIKLHAAGAIYPRTKTRIFALSSNIASEPESAPSSPATPQSKLCRELKSLGRNTTFGSQSTITGRKTSFGSPMNVLKAVKNMDPRMGCCIDVGHTIRTGADVVQAMREAGPRLFNVHMKDLADFKNKESQVAVGEGLMPCGKCSPR
jgi:hypothetical protein